MAYYDNIKIEDSNFCIGPQSGAYYTLNNTGTHYVVYVKNSDGTLVDTYSIHPIDSIDHEVTDSIHGFIYMGPVNQLNPADDLLFYSLECIQYLDCDHCGSRLRVQIRSDVDSCPVCGSRNTLKWKNYPETYYHVSFIKKWIMDNTLKIFNLHSTIEKASTLVSGSNNFEAVGFAVESIRTEFKNSTSANLGYIDLVTVSGINKYDTMVLGPSSDLDNLNGVEYVNVHSVSAPKVEIKTLEPYIPTKNEYIAGDVVVIIKYIYLMCRSRYVNAQKGYLYKLDPNNYGGIIEIKRHYAYNSVSAMMWSDLYKVVVAVCGTQLLFINPYIDYLYSTSVKLFNDINNTTNPIYDIDAIGTTFYMLQRQIVKRFDDGAIISFSWDDYNYSIESLIPATHTVAISFDRGVISVGRICNITVCVKDQFNIPLINKNVRLTKSTEIGQFDPIDGWGLTDLNGECSFTFTLSATVVNEFITIHARVDGASTHLGSGYVWNSIDLFIFSRVDKGYDIYLRPNYDSSIGVVEEWWPQYMTYIILTYSFPGREYSLFIRTYLKNKTHYPPGSQHHLEIGGIRLGKGDDAIPSYAEHYHCCSNQNKDLNFEIDGAVSDTLFIDSLVVSRHFPADVNKMSVDIYQFDFIVDAHPAFFSSKNAYNTYIWISLRPQAFSLDISTVRFRLKESSYAGDTGWMDITSELVMDTTGTEAPFGIVIMWDNTIAFHNSGTVTVFIEVYDTASPPNRIEIVYWFTIVPDFLKPYVENELPVRNSYNVSVDTNISFDILDVGSGVDIDSIEVYVKGRQVRNLNFITIQNGIHVFFEPEIDFLYSDILDIVVYANDNSENINKMVDRWILYCEESEKPWFNVGDFLPTKCSKGVPIHTNVDIQVYGVGGGVDFSSIEFSVDETKRNALITPIIYRIE